MIGDRCVEGDVVQAEHEQESTRKFTLVENLLQFRIFDEDI